MNKQDKLHPDSRKVVIYAKEPVNHSIYGEQLTLGIPGIAVTLLSTERVEAAIAVVLCWDFGDEITQTNERTNESMLRFIKYQYPESVIWVVSRDHTTAELMELTNKLGIKVICMGLPARPEQELVKDVKASVD